MVATHVMRLHVAPMPMPLPTQGFLEIKAAVAVSAVPIVGPNYHACWMCAGEEDALDALHATHRTHLPWACWMCAGDMGRPGCPALGWEGCRPGYWESSIALHGKKERRMMPACCIPDAGSHVLPSPKKENACAFADTLCLGFGAHRCNIRNTRTTGHIQDPKVKNSIGAHTMVIKTKERATRKVAMRLENKGMLVKLEQSKGC